MRFTGLRTKLKSLLRKVVERSRNTPSRFLQEIGRRRSLPVAESLEDRVLLTGEYRLLKDINTATTMNGSRPGEFVSVGSTVYFTAETEEHGRELWKSDLTTNGTQLVRDLFPGTRDSTPEQLINVNGTLYFTAFDGQREHLWKSDGTANGTTRVTSSSGLLTGLPSNANLVNMNGILVFTGISNDHGIELWRTDGTSVGTTLIADVRPGTGGAIFGEVYSTGATVYFSATDDTHGIELWKTDGTSVGTVMVADINSGSASSLPSNMLQIDSTLYFTATDGSKGVELWRSDGTPGGTQMVVEIEAGPTGSYPSLLTNMNGTLVFSATTTSSGSELYVSNGTAGGTALVRDIAPGMTSSGIVQMVAIGSQVYFAAHDGSTGYELWKSDGTFDGTVRIKDLFAGPSSSSPSALTNVNGVLYFGCYTDIGVHELWKSDGTATGTELVRSAPTGDLSPTRLTNANGTLIFQGNNSQGLELWVSDGTDSGTQMVRDIESGTAGANITEPVRAGNLIYFAARDASAGVEIWRSNGTTAGTYRVADLFSGQESSYPHNLTNVNGTIFFTADHPTTGRELWKTDGTATGTVLVKDIFAGASSSTPSWFVNVGGTLYFTAQSPDAGRELWKSDGTTVGTVRVKDIRSGSLGSYPVSLTAAAGQLYFVANGDVNGRELWVSDGTDSGTRMVLDIDPDPGAFGPSGLVSFQSGVFFSATTPSSGTELWRSEGTPGSTFMVHEIVPGTTGSMPLNLTMVSDTLYFTAETPGSGRELWKSNGLAGSGTTQVRDIFPGVDSSSPSMLSNLNGSLVFVAETAETGRELWRSDGTHSGTSLIRDIAPGASSASINWTSMAAGRLFFSANDLLNGDQAWSTDGTASGTIRHLNASGQPLVMDPSRFVELNGSVLFAGTSGPHSQELWRIAVPAPPVIQGPSAVTSQQRPVISWTPIPGAVSYEVFIANQSTNVSPHHQATITPVGGVLPTSYTPNVDLGIGRFNLWVRSRNASNEVSAWSLQHNFQINTPATLTPIQRLQTTPRPVLQWNAIAGAAQYDLWINNLTTGASPAYRITGITGTSWQSGADLPMGLYRAWVRALDASGQAAAWSAFVEFHVLPGATLLSPVTSTFSRRPVFSWNAVTGALSYELTLRDRNTGTIVQQVNGLTSTSWTPTSDLPVAPYRWWVTAVAPGNFRSQSPPFVDFHVGGQTRLLSPGPTTSDTTPTFTWAAVEGAVSYQLYVTRVDVAVAGIINVTGLTGTAYTPTTPLPNGSYRMWIRAVQAGTGTPGPWSDLTTFTIALSAPSRDSEEPLLSTNAIDDIAGVLKTSLNSLAEHRAAADREHDKETAVDRVIPLSGAESVMSERHPVIPESAKEFLWEELMDELADQVFSQPQSLTFI